MREIKQFKLMVVFQVLEGTCSLAISVIISDGADMKHVPVISTTSMKYQPSVGCDHKIVLRKNMSYGRTCFSGVHCLSG